MDTNEKKQSSVLIIDDDIWMQRILSKTLESYGFKQTYLSSNGFEGIGAAVEYLPTLIVMDILMPELSGHLTLKILKSIRITKDIPVIMVSALSDTENLGMAVKYGTAGFISKPFTRATVYDKLVSIFGKEKLDLIAKGEITSLVPNYNDEFYPITNTSAYNNSESNGEPSEAEQDSIPINRKVPQDQLLQHYQDDEKRNIESIKKLLLKSKK